MLIEDQEDAGVSEEDVGTEEGVEQLEEANAAEAIDESGELNGNSTSALDGNSTSSLDGNSTSSVEGNSTSSSGNEEEENYEEEEGEEKDSSAEEGSEEKDSSAEEGSEEKDSSAEEGVEDIKPEDENNDAYDQKDLDKDAEIAAQVEMIMSPKHKK